MSQVTLSREKLQGTKIKVPKLFLKLGESAGFPDFDLLPDIPKLPQHTYSEQNVLNAGKFHPNTQKCGSSKKSLRFILQSEHVKEGTQNSKLVSSSNSTCAN